MYKNLDRLRIFFYIFSLGSISETSKLLNISQSAISQTLQKLEKELESHLFTRQHKKLIPTESGIKLFKIVKSFMSDLENYSKELKYSKEFPYGELRVGAPQEFGKTYLSHIISQFRKLYKDVIFSLKLSSPDVLLEDLKQGNLDFIIVDEFLINNPISGKLDTLLFTPIVDEKIILACSKDYYNKNINGDHTFKSISNQDFISYSKDKHKIREWFIKHFSKKSINPKTVMSVDNHEAIVSGIMNNLGMGIVASHLVKSELDSGEMIHIKTNKNDDIINTISLVQLLDKIPSLAEKKFSQFLIETIQEKLSNGIKI